MAGGRGGRRVLELELDPRRRAAGYQTLSALRDELQVLFSVLAMHGSEDETEARRAYEIGMESMLPGIRPPFAKPGHWPPRVDQALTRYFAFYNGRRPHQARRPAG